jgi:antitoxin (DNA-binding transcriptional repressor) of toxin-antitoxin stability system
MLRRPALAQKTRATVYRLPITKARINLGQLVRRVATNKEYFILEKDGIPIAGILGADELEDYLELRDAKAQAAIRNSAVERQAGKGRPMGQFLADLGAEPRRRASSRRKAP